MIRKILSILAGYTIFVAASLAFFKITGQNPHSAPSNFFIILTAIFGSIFSFAAGLLSRHLAKTADLKINYVLAIIIAGFAAFSYFKSEGNHWTQLLAIFIFAPVSILGGLFYHKRNNKQ
jgi:ABC-type Fe3+-siderophore transport system permease subunit